MKKREFQDKIVIITGAASGLGTALCRKFSQAGANVIGLDIDEKGLENVRQRFAQEKISFAGYFCDVTDENRARDVFQEVLTEHGPIDLLINNAGLSHRSAFATTELSVIRKVMEINFFGAVNCTKHALQSLISQKGMIVVLSSVAGFSPLIARTGYAASKYALHGFFESLRSEVREEGVDVMMVCPSFIKTNIGKNALGADGNLVSHQQIPVGNYMTPESAASHIFEGASRRKKKLLIGRVSKLSYWVYKFLPAFYERQMRKKLIGEMGGR